MIFIQSERLKQYFEQLRNASTTPDRRVNPLFHLGIGLALFYPVVSVLIFNFHHYVEKIIDSNDICSNQFLYDTMSWMLPKAASHCDLISTALYFNHYKGVALVLDLWIFIVFLLQTALGFKLSLIVHSDRKNELCELFRERRGLGVNSMLLSLLFCLITIFAMFYDHALVGEWRHRDPWLAMLADYYGFGAGLLTLVIGSTSFFFFGSFSIILFAFLKGFRKMNTASKQTP